MAAELKPGYNDLYFRIIISLIAAHIIVTFGAKESFFELLMAWYYYRDLALSFVIAFLLISEVYLVTVKLDRRFDWLEDTAKRIGLQSLFGLVIPAVSAFLLAAAYFGILGYNVINDTGYLQYDFSVIVIMLLVLNVYYLAFYFYRRWQYAEGRLKAAPIIENHIEHSGNKHVIIVQDGSNNVPVTLENICYFYHDGNYNFVRTIDEDNYIVPQTLDEIQQALPVKQFFRVNRRMIVNFKACQHFKAGRFGKLELFVNPAMKQPVIVSQKRVRQFKQWIER